MVSIDKIQKANRLSKELKKHGFAYDAGDAFSQAEQIYDKKRHSPEVEFATENGTLVLESQENAGEEIEEIRDRINALERFKDFCLRKNGDHKDQYEEFSEKLGDLSKSLNLVEMNQQAFERKLSEVKNSSPKPSCSCGHSSGEVHSEEPSPEVSSEPSSESPHPVATEEKIEEPIDKTGIAPADVSVEKIFYVGNK